MLECGNFLHPDFFFLYAKQDPKTIPQFPSPLGDFNSDIAWLLDDLQSFDFR